MGLSSIERFNVYGTPRAASLMDASEVFPDGAYVVTDVWDLRGVLYGVFVDKFTYISKRTRESRVHIVYSTDRSEYAKHSRLIEVSIRNTIDEDVAPLYSVLMTLNGDILEITHQSNTPTVSVFHHSGDTTEDDTTSNKYDFNKLNLRSIVDEVRTTLRDRSTFIRTYLENESITKVEDIEGVAEDEIYCVYAAAILRELDDADIRCARTWSAGDVGVDKYPLAVRTGTGEVSAVGYMLSVMDNVICGILEQYN